MTEAEAELITSTIALHLPANGPEEVDAKYARQRAALSAVNAERLGPMAGEVRACIRRQLEAQRDLRKYSELPGFQGENGACVAIWREVEIELGMRDR